MLNPFLGMVIRQYSRIGFFLILLTLHLLLLGWSWGKWLDPIVDFGRELYVPWRIAHGDVLYRDIAYFNGPLASHLNALLFSWFGEGLLVLVISNAALLLAFSWVLFLWIERFSDQWHASVCSMLFLALFGFNQLDRTANFNFICPYSHDLTFGLILSGLSLFLLDRGAGWSGLLFGLVFLTKAEVFLALALSTALILTLKLARMNLRQFAKMAAVGPLGSLFYLGIRSGPKEALLGTLGTWVHLGHARVWSNPFYLWNLGIDRPWTNLAISWFAAAFVAGALLCFGRFSSHRSIARDRWIEWAVPLLIFAGMVFYLSRASLVLNWVTRGLPWLLVGNLVFLVSSRNQSDPRHRARLLAAVAFFGWSFGLLFKIFLNVQPAVYGFALSAPAFLCGFLTVSYYIPKAFSLSHKKFRWIAMGAVAPFVLVGFVESHKRFSEKVVPVGEGRDRFYTEPKNRAVPEVIEYINRELRPQRDLLVSPEGVMLNYLSRRKSPSPYIVQIPIEMELFGEEAMIEGFKEAHAPYWVWVGRKTPEYGVPEFGLHYGKALAGRVRKDYEVKRAFGAAGELQIAVLEPKTTVRPGSTESGEKRP